MEARRLGRTGFDVSILGLGGHVHLATDYRGDFCIIDQRAALIRYLTSHGVNFVDTKWINEVRVLAATLRRAGMGAGLHVAMQYADGISKPDWRENLRGELESRLEIMGYDRAPLFSIGVGNGPVPYSEIVAGAEALDALKSEGIVGKIGIACHQISYHSHLIRLIEETDLIDYLFVRFNWKHPEARTDLLEVAAERNVGVILMKVFCWDRGPGQWQRRLSVFEPLSAEERVGNPPALTAAQRCLVWTLRQSRSAVAILGMNSMWEAEQNIRALEHLGEEVDTSDFEAFAARLWNPDCLAEIVRSAQSATIRQRALDILDSL